MKRFQDKVGIVRGAGSGMQKRQTREMLDRPFDQSSVKTGLAQEWGTDPTNVDGIRAITLCQNSERLLEASTMGWLSASILHDLRNPLGTICAGAELLIDLDSTSTQVKRLAGNMARAAGRMRHLLAELASLAPDHVSTREICDIRQVIAGAAEAALAAMGTQSLQIQLDVPVGIELPLVRSHIERVFFNLIVNAIEAMPCGGKVRVGARKVGACIHVELEDTGPGIPDCIRDRLFEPFITSGKQNGLGLGLALARQTVRNQGGDIWSETAAGARFVIGLPLRQPCRVLRRAASSENCGRAAQLCATVAHGT